MPVLEETNIGDPQVKTSIADYNKPTTPLKTETIVKKNENTTPKINTAASVSK